MVLWNLMYESFSYYPSSFLKDYLSIFHHSRALQDTVDKKKINGGHLLHYKLLSI